MSGATVTLGEHLYDAKVKLTRTIEYGASLRALVAGEQTPPPSGARFDIHFEGELRGPRLQGTVTGIDYLHVRADGRIDLHVHGEITTVDEEQIAFFADGVALPQEGSARWQLRENVRLSTASSKYGWVNVIPIWGQGTVDLETQEITVKAYGA